MLLLGSEYKPGTVVCIAPPMFDYEHSVCVYELQGKSSYLWRVYIQVCTQVVLCVCSKPLVLYQIAHVGQCTEELVKHVSIHGKLNYPPTSMAESESCVSVGISQRKVEYTLVRNMRE